MNCTTSEISYSVGAVHSIDKIDTCILDKYVKGDHEEYI